MLSLAAGARFDGLPTESYPHEIQIKVDFERIAALGKEHRNALASFGTLPRVLVSQGSRFGHRFEATGPSLVSAVQEAKRGRWSATGVPRNAWDFLSYYRNLSKGVLRWTGARQSIYEKTP